MNKQEFLDTLAKALRRELSDREVMDNIQYYDNYIEQEKRNGKSESEVLAGLGDPRLIAKTILQVEEQREEQIYTGTEEGYAGDRSGGYSQQGYGAEEDPYAKGMFDHYRKVHNISKTKFWIIVIAILIVLFAVLKTAFVIAWKLLPVIAVVGLVMWFYHKYIERK